MPTTEPPLPDCKGTNIGKYNGLYLKSVDDRSFVLGYDVKLPLSDRVQNIRSLLPLEWNGTARFSYPPRFGDGSAPHPCKKT